MAHTVNLTLVYSEARVCRALNSYRELLDVIPDMTLGDVLRALEVESRTKRRGAVLDRLYSRASSAMPDHLKGMYNHG